MADIESKILSKELGKLGGFGARLAARFLPNVAHEDQASLKVPSKTALSVVGSFFSHAGKSIPELPSTTSSFSMIIGSGQLDLNPTIVQARIEETSTGVNLVIRAVAKEGAIQQHSAQLAVGKVKEAILAELAHFQH